MTPDQLALMVRALRTITDSLIMLLDEIDTDPDDEPDADAEPDTRHNPAN